MSVKVTEIDVTVSQKSVMLPQIVLKAAENDVTVARNSVTASEIKLKDLKNNVTLARLNVTLSEIMIPAPEVDVIASEKAATGTKRPVIPIVLQV